jgi:hypothetical protein
MAITKVAQFGSTLEGQSDYQAQNAHINAFIQQMMGDPLHLTNFSNTKIPAIAQGVYIAHAGVLYVVDTSDYTIVVEGSLSSRSYYIKLSVSGDTLVAAWESSLSGFAWNSVYNGLYSGTTQLLPYVVAYDGSSSYVKYKYDFQTGNGVSFDQLMLSGSILPKIAALYNTGPISPSGEIILPRGLYMFQYNPLLIFKAYFSGSWTAWQSPAPVYTIVSDGTNIKATNSSSSETIIFYALKF